MIFGQFHTSNLCGATMNGVQIKIDQQVMHSTNQILHLLSSEEKRDNLKTKDIRAVTTLEVTSVSQYGKAYILQTYCTSFTV